MAEINRIDVEKIMSEIRAEISQKKLKADFLPFEKVVEINEAYQTEFNYNEFLPLVSECNAICEVMAYRPLDGNPIKVFIKKVIRKCSKFYVEPIVQSQNEFNAFAVRTINCVNTYIGEHCGDVTVSGIEKRISILELELQSRNLDRSFNAEENTAENYDEDITPESFSIEKIMQQIRLDIIKKGNLPSSDNTILPSGKFDLDELTRNLGVLNQIYDIPSEREVKGRFKFIKKIVRKALRFYIDPIVQNQIQYNAFVVRTLNMVSVYIKDSIAMSDVVKELAERIDRLEAIV